MILNFNFIFIFLLKVKEREDQIKEIVIMVALAFVPFSFILFERKKTQELNLKINNQLLQSFLLSKINEKRWRS